ncbi:MAG: CHAT domain-containing tetratricopeptide repeat protein [Verrucomicrobiota bacterium]
MIDSLIALILAISSVTEFSVDDLIAQKNYPAALERLTPLIAEKRANLSKAPSAAKRLALGQALLTKGMVLDRNGQSKEALLPLTEACELLSKTDWLGDAWDALGKAHQHSGNYPKAESAFLNAITARDGDPHWQAVSRDHLGLLKILQGEIHEAGHLFHTNLSNTTDPASEITTFRRINYGRYLHVAQRHQESLTQFQLALQYAAKPEDRAIIHAEIADLFLEQQHPEKALTELEKARQLLSIENPAHLLTLAELSNNAASVLLDLGEPQQARTLLLDLLPFFEKRSGTNSPLLPILQTSLAESLHQLEQFDEADRLFDTLIKRLHETVGPVSLPSLRAERLRLLNNLSRSRTSPSQANQTLDLHRQLTRKIARQGSEVEKLSYFFHASTPLIAKATSPETIAHYSLNTKALIFDSLLLTRSQSPKTARKASQIQNTLLLQPGNQVLRDQLNTLQQELSPTLPKSISPKEIADALPAKTVLVDFVRYLTTTEEKSPTTTYGALIYQSGSTPSWHPNLISETALLAYLKTLYGSLQDQLRSSLNPEAQAPLVRPSQILTLLHKNLWSPLANSIPPATEHLLLCPDGQLHQTPFAILCETDQNLLLQRFQTLNYVVHPRINNPPPRLPQDPSNWTLVGIPQQHPPKPLATPSPHLEQFLHNLPSLHGADAERKLINRLFPNLIWRASEANLPSKPPHVLHWIGHGYFSELESDSLREHLFSSCLVLSKPGHHTATNKDDLWFAEEIAASDFSKTHLVTLSACNTAQGFRVSGEGLVGLRRAFALAGAQNQLATLWPISDSATPEFMHQFYQQYASNQNPAASLANTQKSFLKKTSAKLFEDRLAQFGSFLIYSQNPLAPPP